MSPHWHDHNPWRDDIVYISLDEMRECAGRGENWPSRYGDKLDPYILPQPSGEHSLGVRYGAEPHEYLSPPNRFTELTQTLLEKYRVAR